MPEPAVEPPPPQGTDPASSAAERAAVRAVDLTKAYGTGKVRTLALDRVSVAFANRRFTAVMGPSGSGKSTLLHCVAGLDDVTSGKVFVRNTELTALPGREVTRLRRERLGFVFQAFNLIPHLTAAENVMLPLTLARRPVDPEWRDTVVRTLGLQDRLSHRPAELSGGQQQRVAVARALITRPQVVFADEPTGNLDSRTGADVLDLLRRAVDDLGQTIVMVTHDPRAAARADRVVLLADGRMAGDLDRPTVPSVLEALVHLGGR